MDPQGYDAGREVTGRKRHVLVDTLGLLWELRFTVPLFRIATVPPLCLTSSPARATGLP
jgi:hypothetical protein